MNTVIAKAPFVYLTGPVRSGKSRWAVERARAWPLSAERQCEIVFVATYRATRNTAAGAPEQDSEMAARIARHRAERPAWRTLEAPAEIAKALADLNPKPSGVVIDCLTLWLSDRLEREDEAILKAWRNELVGLRELGVPVIIVGNEVGWSLVPESPVLRRFRDLTGLLSQNTAAAADEAWLVVAGCPIPLKKGN
jgi:adenosylcobinamide kinase/adenosylcobinamide-phosphate guanylyltransferase